MTDGRTDSASQRPGRGFLGIYLQDHHAASAAGVDLARRLARHGRNETYGQELAELAREIAFDREALTSVLATLEVKSNLAKTVVARLGERLARLKPNGSLASYSPLDQLIGLETLATGIVAKRALWRSLLAASESTPTLSREGIEKLIAAAEVQFERVERIRVETATAAFTGNLPQSLPESA